LVVEDLTKLSEHFLQLVNVFKDTICPKQSCINSTPYALLFNLISNSEISANLKPNLGFIQDSNQLPGAQMMLMMKN
jgi:hypothetical protein